MVPPRDGWEGLGNLAAVFPVILVIVAVLFVTTVFRKLRGSATQQDSGRGRYIWASLFAYGVSAMCGFEFAVLALTDDSRKTAIMAGLGTLFALTSLGLAVYARGAGRILAMVSSAFLTILWTPMFFGRVLAR